MGGHEVSGAAFLNALAALAFPLATFNLIPAAPAFWAFSIASFAVVAGATLEVHSLMLKDAQSSESESPAFLLEEELPPTAMALCRPTIQRPNQRIHCTGFIPVPRLAKTKALSQNALRKNCRRICNAQKKYRKGYPMHQAHFSHQAGSQQPNSISALLRLPNRANKQGLH